ncbi:uncharacterized protein LOC117115095 [Anneissia japonica]|uniref:uncharacterized protein LOC117115095 n=1 Tax=Anneissia japonica TaxID=1529436 RepID=UPI0014256258|nr:uncharacterized protein LOC117115095 [Anneissia japonica]
MAQNKDHARSEAELILGLHDVIRAQEKKIHRQQSQISHLNFMVVKLTEDRDRLARLLSRYSSDSRGRKMERTIYSIREDTKKADKIDRDALCEFDMASRTTWYIDL